MFANRRSLARCTDGELVRSLIIGSVICLLFIDPTFFIHQQPEWLPWMVRGYGGIWLLNWWRLHLGEFFRRRN